MPPDARMLDALFASPHINMALLDRRFRFLRVNAAYAESCGRPPEWFVGRGHFDLYPSPEAEDVFRRVRDSGESYAISELAFQHPNQPQRGTTYWNWSLHPIPGADGRTENVLLTIVDVTERVRARRLAAERELLVQELNHRVKNNLQIVASLATLQSASHPHAAEPLKEFAEKVHIIGKVHERLALDPDLSTVDMQRQLEDLCDGLMAVHGRRGLRCAVDAPALMPVDEAMPVSLLVAELVINALKHSFPDGREGTVRVVMHSEDGRACTLRVADDGVGGVVTATNGEEPQSLGLRIIAALARQIGGRLAITSDEHGTEWRIRFRCPESCSCAC